MKTTHQIANELLGLPDVPLLIEGWTADLSQEIFARLIDCSPDTFAMLIQRPPDFFDPKPE